MTAEADLSLAGYPEVSSVGDIAWITNTKTDEVMPQLGSVALQAGEHAGESSRGASRGSRASPSATSANGRWRLSATVRRASRCPEDGLSRSERRGLLGLEDFTKERPGRITANPEEVE